ncbi:MAG: VCBS repeat-containing protein [Saprospiraceae bacterium]|nr:VCBS repeat-containing protein [Saprospiraceae bacterium]
MDVMNRLLHFLIALLGVLTVQAQSSLFTKLPSSKPHITFNNKIIENEKINIITYEYFHNGGGVAIGDINNDGLADVYLTGNLVPNRLFLNKGNFQFEDITESSGTAGTRGWNTGVTMVDINNDGWLDIYVCLSGNLPTEYRANQLFVNNQDGTFSERAAEYGIADTGYATQAAFFDYDRDGDLDLFILNHNTQPINDFKPSEVRSAYDSNVGDKLYRNDNGTYRDASLIAGFYTNPLGYGLGVSIGDINNDGWPDIYVSNDFIEHDYCYLNNGDGSFRDVVKEAFPQISQFSMGTDMADFNNDGWTDIISVDMVAEDNYRQKTTMRPMDRSIFYYAVQDGFHYQYMHNALQLNRGNGHFSNISKLAGVSNTDWSWAPLFVDLDLDGNKDLVITNGYKKDISNKDYLSFEKKKIKAFKTGEITNAELFRSLLEAAPITKIENYVFRNNGNYTFSKMNEAWNFDHKAFSNGAAYGDLDNDGDLDLVINNIDEPAYLFRNNTIEQEKTNYIRLKLLGSNKNSLGIGAKVKVKAGELVQYYEAHLTRGFQSSVDPIISVGLANHSLIDSIEVTWPDGKVTVETKITANQLLVLSYDKATQPVSKAREQQYLFTDITTDIALDAKHVENEFDDFDHEVLLPHKMSNWGPALATTDVNGDGLTDFFLGGAAGLPGQLYVQKSDGSLKKKQEDTFAAHLANEDIDAIFFDADQDGDQDLYVVSGGNEFAAGAQEYADRLYLNDGQGGFSYKEGALPNCFTSGGVVRPFDFDGDGNLDLFVGGRMQPRSYPKPANSDLLRNRGDGTFEDVTHELAPALKEIGMITDAVWCDYDQDQDMDLVLTGEWMPITILENTGSQFTLAEDTGLEDKVGWWFSIESADMDGDGDQDFLVGNLGLNYKYKASAAEPFEVYLNDFDENGSLDIVLGYFEENELYPVRGRQCSAEQMPFIKDRFPTYDLFGQANLSEIYGESSLEKSLNYKVTDFASSYIENLGNGRFEVHALPIEAQFSAINSFLLDDFNGDGHLDAITAGNLFASEVETPRNDAGVGALLLGNGKGAFSAIPAHESGLYLPYDVKRMQWINTEKGKRILVAPNNERLRMIQVR